MERVVRRVLTVDDYCQLPEGPPHYQLVQGELIMSPSPTRFHQEISRRLISLLDAYIQRHRCGVLYHAPLDVFLGPQDVVQPDLVYVSNQRQSILSERGIEGAPDLVVEILSPSTRKLDLGAKKTLFSEAGVGELWVIDPDARTLAVYRIAENRGDPEGVFGDGEVMESRCLPRLSVKVGRILARS